jgi:hypothetical protein
MNNITKLDISIPISNSYIQGNLNLAENSKSVLFLHMEAVAVVLVVEINLLLKC